MKGIDISDQILQQVNGIKLQVNQAHLMSSIRENIVFIVAVVEEVADIVVEGRIQHKNETAD
jgi:hypothetical protein